MFAVALAADLTAKAVLAQVTYQGFAIVSFTPAPLWLVVPAVLSLFFGSRLLTAASCLTLAGVVGNAVSGAGVLDFGGFGAWSLASFYLLGGLVLMAVALVLRLRATTARPAPHAAG